MPALSAEPMSLDADQTAFDQTAFGQINLLAVPAEVKAQIKNAILDPSSWNTNAYVALLRLVEALAGASLDAARKSVAAAKGTVIERGTVPCQTCRRPHDLRRLGDDDKAPVSWADPVNGHLYVRMTAEQVVELSEAWTTERHPEDDAECERLGCEDRTHPVHHRVATALPPNCIAVDREYYEVLRDCYMNQPAAPPVPAEPWQETARRAMSCSCPFVVRLNHEPHRPPCPLAGETL